MDTVIDPPAQPDELIAKLSGDNAADKALLMAVRQSFLHMVDAIEKRLGVSPTTAEIRNWYKINKK